MATTSERTGNDAALIRPQDGTRSFWTRLTANPAYRRASDLLLSSDRRRFWLLAVPALIWMFGTHLGPILTMIRISFLDSYPPTAGRIPELTLENYLLFFQAPNYITPFVRTFVYASCYTLLTLLLMYPIAYFLAKKLRPGRQMLFLLLLLVPFWVGEIVRTYAIMILLGNRGFLNIVLMGLGLTSRPIPFMYTGFSLGMGLVYLTSLYMLLPLYASLEKIPRNYLEAAADLGAGSWTRFRRVTLPLSKDGIASGCVLVFLISTGYYATPVLLGGPSTTVFAETIAGFFHVAGDKWPEGAAFSTIMLLASLVTVGLFLRLLGRRSGSLLG
jgi:spermidine/putrescine transport system permease protein